MPYVITHHLKCWRADTCMLTVSILLLLPRYSEAMVYLTLLRKQQPSHVGGLCQLATCLMQNGSRELAKKLFSEALKLNPNHTMTLQNFSEL